jgi:hypothetical protein
MPKFGTFNINNDLLDEYKRVRTEVYGNLYVPKKPSGKVRTTLPNRILEINEWFLHIFKTNREIEERKHKEMFT